jgi:hypothetical protein
MLDTWTISQGALVDVCAFADQSRFPQCRRYQTTETQSHILAAIIHFRHVNKKAIKGDLFPQIAGIKHAVPSVLQLLASVQHILRGIPGIRPDVG